MRLNIPGILTVFTLLTVVRRLTHAVPAPSSVSVKCDSYGVVVEWKANGLSEQAEFLLELKSDFGNSNSVITTYPSYNISNLLQDTAYNHYFVKVKAKDGEYESEFAESQIFSFNFLKQANITCGLEFPTVNLFPRDGKLVVNFINPLHLYRDTPALRILSQTDILQYTINNNKISKECVGCPLECPSECFLECPLASETCESNVSFPEEQKEYCVTLLGRIRQTRVWKTKPFCYQGTLNPGPPVTTYLIVALGSLAAFFTLALAIVFLVREFFRRRRKFKKKNLAKIPIFLKDKLTHTPLIKPEQEPVDENPRVEPAVKIPPNSTCYLEESTTQPETSATTSSDNLTDCAEDKDTSTSSGSSEQDTSFYQDRLQYGNGAELSSSDLSMGYDRPHTLEEMSPGDTVKTYGS